MGTMMRHADMQNKVVFVQEDVCLSEEVLLATDFEAAVKVVPLKLLIEPSASHCGENPWIYLYPTCKRYYPEDALNSGCHVPSSSHNIFS